MTKLCSANESLGFSVLGWLHAFFYSVWVDNVTFLILAGMSHMFGGQLVLGKSRIVYTLLGFHMPFPVKAEKEE